MVHNFGLQPTLLEWCERLRSYVLPILPTLCFSISVSAPMVSREILTNLRKSGHPSQTTLFWTRHYDIALDDLAKLVAPDQVVLCEGASESGKDAFDAACYNKIFANDHPRTLFISVGSSADIETRIPALVQILEQIVCGTDVILLRDRDDMSSHEIERKRVQKYSNIDTI